MSENAGGQEEGQGARDGQDFADGVQEESDQVGLPGHPDFDFSFRGGVLYRHSI